jgi:GAF domain-containing protein
MAGQAAQAATPDAASGMPSAADPHLPDVSRLELDQLLVALRDRAGEVLSTKGRLRALLHANAAVASDLNLSSVLRRIVDAARELLAAQGAAVAVLGLDGRVEELVQAGLDESEVRHLIAAPPGTQPPGGADVVAVPIRHGDDNLGTLYLSDRVGGGSFTLEDRELAAALAASAGVAISNARLFAESERRRSWLSAAGALTRQLLSSSAEEPFDAITRQGATAAGADFATLFLPSNGDCLVATSEHGAGAGALIGRPFPIEGTMAGVALRTGKPFLLRADPEDPVVAARGVETGPLIVAPIAAGEEVRGVLALGRAISRSSFTDADKSMAAGFGSHAAIALALVEARSDQLQLARLEDHERIARDLHDHIIQEIFAVGMGLQAVVATVTKPYVQERISTYVDRLDRVVTSIRRAIFQLQHAVEAEDNSAGGGLGS